MSVTIVDVAKRAGVSVSTVSKYINGGNVIEPKRSEIKAAIEELGFVANPIARGMKTRKTNTIGVLIPGMSEFFGVALLTHLNKYMYEKNYTVVTCDYKFDEFGTNAREKIGFLVHNHVDGIIMQPDAFKENEVDAAVEANIPIVVVDLEDEFERFDSVVLDNESLGYEATRKFIDNGHRRIAIVTGYPNATTSQKRVAGYKKALAEAGIECNEKYIFMGKHLEIRGYETMERIFAMPEEERPTAVFIAGNVLMMGSLLYFKKNNKSIPEDISIIGMENIQAARIFNPTIDIATQPMELFAEAAADLLLTRIEKEYTGPKRTVKLYATFQPGETIKKL
ncbi:MAG: LacI family transcriptional regulator [Clostridia bacterium]|nr:LacI family transcriptional regulator [Clostridia bacterium]